MKVFGIDFSGGNDDLIVNHSMQERLNYYRNIVANAPKADDTVHFSAEAKEKLVKDKAEKVDKSEKTEPAKDGHSLWEHITGWFS